MELGLRGKRAVITGASKGIGRGIAEELAAEGCDLELVSRTAADLKKAEAEIKAKHNVGVRTHAVDLSQSGELEKLGAAIKDCDILVNNAGAIRHGNIAAMTEANWRSDWELKVFGYINLCRIVHAAMIERKSGVIINIIGIAGQLTNQNYIAGSTGNALLMKFTEALGSYALDHGVRVVGINPGAILSERLDGLLRRRAKLELGDENRWQEITKTMPGGRPGQPREIGAAVAFLASSRASYITGCVIPVDGGLAHRHAN